MGGSDVQRSVVPSARLPGLRCWRCSRYSCRSDAIVTDLLDAGAEPATARARHLSLRRFSAWLVDEGEADEDWLLGSKPPKLDAKVIEPLTEDDLRNPGKACAGRDLRDRRDEAIVRFMLETGTRAGETVDLLSADVDLSAGTAIVRCGTGGKGRIVPFGPQTSRAIDRYMRLRRGHRLAKTPALWLGDRGKPFNYDGLHKTLKYRAALAGIPERRCPSCGGRERPERSK